MIQSIFILFVILSKLTVAAPLLEYTDLSAPPSEPYVYTVQHANINELTTILHTEFPNYSIYKKQKENELVIFAPKKHHRKLRGILKKLDTPEDIIPLQVNVHEVTYTSVNDYKTLLSSVGDGINTNINLENGSLSMTNPLEEIIKALEAKGNATLIANPNIKVLNNHTASLHIGDQIPYVSAITQSTTQTVTIQRVNTGIALDVTPYLSPQEELFLDIHLTISSVKVWKPIGTLEYPVLSNRKFNTRVKFKPEETLIISGLTQTSNQETSQRVPILGHIPLLGVLFRSKKTETLHSDILIQIEYAAENILKNSALAR
jgi:type II secretory pathway component GspD/PulD (secretin)